MVISIILFITISSIVNITPPFKPVKIKEFAEYSMAINKEKKQLIIYLKVNNLNYFAIGTGTIMKNSDMVVLSVTDNNLTVGDYKAIGYRKPDKLEAKEWSIVEKSINGNGYEVLLSRTYTDSDNKFNILKEDYYDFIWSTNKDCKDLCQHFKDSRGSLNYKINFTGNKEDDDKNDEDTDFGFDTDDTKNSKFFLYFYIICGFGVLLSLITIFVIFKIK